MRLPNQFLVYVSDVASAAAFYGELFGMQAQMLSHRYASSTWEVGSFSHCGEGRPERPRLPRPRPSRSGFWLRVGAEDPRDLRRVGRQGVEVVEEPSEDVFGLTFVAADLDGNRIRVAPAEH
ncbi:glyoxalase [Rhodococcus hoagii]|nr:glyoxalase [Prescottella equi]